MEKQIKVNPLSKRCNRIAYISFLLVGVTFLYNKKYSDAMMYLGLAFIFDPFNPAVPYKNRPLYQRLWLLVHLAITILVLVLMFVLK